MFANEQILVGLEVGTSKVCAVVAEVLEDGNLMIIGVGQTPAEGVRKGEIVDMEVAAHSIQNAISEEENRPLLGRTVEILVEGPSKTNAARLTGRTRCNKIVVLDGSPRHLGRLLDVKVQRAGNFTLYGEAVEG